MNSDNYKLEQIIVDHCSSNGHLWYGFDISDERGFTRLIKYIENVIRHSPEYKCWARWCKELVDNTNCPICKVEYQFIKEETHHFPKTLFTVVEEEINQRLDTLDELTPMDLIIVIIKRHLANKVDFVNLCETCHKKFHANDYEMYEKVDSLYMSNFQHFSCKEQCEPTHPN